MRCPIIKILSVKMLINVYLCLARGLSKSQKSIELPINAINQYTYLNFKSIDFPINAINQCTRTTTFPHTISSILKFLHSNNFLTKLLKLPLQMILTS